MGALKGLGSSLVHSIGHEEPAQQAQGNAKSATEVPCCTSGTEEHNASIPRPPAAPRGWRTLARPQTGARTLNAPPSPTGSMVGATHIVAPPKGDARARSLVVEASSYVTPILGPKFLADTPTSKFSTVSAMALDLGSEGFVPKARESQQLSSCMPSLGEQTVASKRKGLLPPILSKSKDAVSISYRWDIERSGVLRNNRRAHDIR